MSSLLYSDIIFTFEYNWMYKNPFLFFCEMPNKLENFYY